jgi:sugar phosphate isomerase/epimerase
MLNKMEIKYTCTYWGCEHLSAKEFLFNVLAHGYDGVEINFPDDAHFINEFLKELERIKKTVNPDFVFIAQQVLNNQNETVEAYTNRLTQRLNFLTSLQPDAINSHTGKDFFSFGDNCKIIDVTEQIAKNAGIPIWHEIHRGRFSFHLKTLQQYLELFPHLKLIADFSHFCVVSESLLQDQEDLLLKVYPFVKHIHARIGFEQSPQVNNQFAPEWQTNLNRYTNWWQEIINLNKKNGINSISITPECGPFPYMPQEPFSLKPLSNQWETNVSMKNYLQQTLQLNG